MNLCGKQDKSNVWPPFMLISWQSLVLYGYFIIKKKIFWKGLIIPINAILGKCPGVTPAMNSYRKQYSSFYWPQSILIFRQNWVLYCDFIIKKKNCNNDIFFANISPMHKIWIKYVLFLNPSLNVQRCWFTAKSWIQIQRFSVHRS